MRYNLLIKVCFNVVKRQMTVQSGVFLVNGRVAFLHFGSNLESDYLVEVDKWYFITCTYSPGRKIYVNSQFVTSDADSALNISNFSAKLGAN
jgi:hypothetical protein